MKSILIAVLAAAALVGCNNPDRDVAEQKKDATKDQLNAQKQAVDQAADAARNRADAQNKAEKAQIDAQEKAQKAQIEADKDKADAQAKAEKKIADAREDAAQGAPGAVRSGSVTERHLQGTMAGQTFHGRVTSVNRAAGTLTVTDANGNQEFKLDKSAMKPDLKEGETVSVRYHRQGGANIADSVNVTGQEPPEVK